MELPQKLNRMCPLHIIAGFRHSAQHRPVAGLPGGQGHQAAREHIRRTPGLPLPVRGDLHPLRHGERPRVRALHPGLQLPRRGEIIKNTELSALIF